MGLQRYREKRDFAVTPEPAGGERSKTGFSYVIQKHAASHLHYDFRLELDGVLLSWAVPKGPSLDPKVRRLAMQTEDHPIDYGGFEGTIPQGEYGGGTVMVWDRGTWEPLEDPRKSYAKGHLRFALHGDKLRGAWHLVRTGKASDEKKGWLLFKSQDDEARASGSIVEELQDSAATGRTLEQIANARDKVWHSNRAAKGAASTSRRRPPAPRRDEKLDALIEHGKAAPLPTELDPQRATAVKKVPEGPKWAHELKYDGHRILARLDKGAVTLLDGDGEDWTGKVPAVAELIADLPFATALFDGEIAVQRPDGTTDSELLENALREGGRQDVTFFVFDVLYLNGRDLRRLPLRQRKEILERATAANSDPRMHFSRHLVASGEDFFKAACKLRAEGVVSKKLDRPYQSGKGKDWVTTRCTPRKKAKVKAKPKPKATAAPSNERAHGQAAHATKAKGASTAGVRLTHPERVLYPREKITKQELAEYYAAVSAWMVPHVANRPLTLVRCPQGVGKQKFFQKHAKPPLPKAIRAIPIDDEGSPTEYMAIDDRAGLLELVQMSVLEIHTWGAHADDPEKPDFLVFDLDPDAAVKWPAVIACARLLRDALAQLSLESYVKTTGGKGLHVCVPIARRVSWDEAKEFCRALTELLVRLNPNAYVATMSKAQRSGKIFIDFFRNGRGATFIAPYSTRARDGAPVAMPLAWEELSPQLGADHFNIRNVMKRMAELTTDPWKDASTKKQVLTAAAIRAVMKPERTR
ncbi:MAG TPA: non-homologous end-joining DNA ligase [Polyangiaceae bacterium]|nr:non-homologous end-joining DNA ligase [Polyangiaceae bacterium]